MKKLGLLAAVLIAASGVQATLVDFEGISGASSYGVMPGTYQPLANDGVTITYTGIGTYDLGGDHTTGSGWNAYAQETAGGAFSFSKDVQLTSMWLANYTGAASGLGVTVTAYSDEAGFSLLRQSVVTTETHASGSGFIWTEFTGFSDLTNVRRLEISSPDYAQIDDMSINVIPEPATFGLVGLAGASLLFVRRRFMI